MLAVGASEICKLAVHVLSKQKAHAEGQAGRTCLSDEIWLRKKIVCMR